MGRSIYSDQLKTQPPGFFLEVNNSLLEGLWAALALEKHPEIADEPHELERTFLLCKHVSWADFWRAFPYKLREGGSYLDELDALGLLLSSSVSKQRFQRYFEQYACSQSNSSSPGAVQINSSTPTMQDAAQQQQQQQRQNSNAFRLGLRLDQMSDGEMRRAVMPGRYRGQYQPLFQQQQQRRQEPRQPRAVRFPTAAAAGGAAAEPVAYVPPPARPLLPLAAAAAGRARPATAAGSSRAAAAAAARTAAAPAAAGTAAAAVARLTGRRRTWTEVCEETGPPAPAAAAELLDQQQLAATTAATAAAAAAEEAEPAGPSAAAGVGEQLGPELDNSNMWRAVHDWLTADDEALLVIVSRLVPYNFEGLLRDTASVREQLQQLANSRPVLDKVVQAISDRMSATSDNNLIRLTASSGYSRRAAAAAAALACSDRAPYYISLAGLCKEEDLEAAILEGLFGENLSRSGTLDNPDDTAAAAAADLDAAVASVAQQMRDHPSDGGLTAENAAAAAAILTAAAAARPQTVLEAVEAALTQNGRYTFQNPATADVERVRDMARQLQAAPSEVVVAATAEAAAAVTDLVAQFRPAAGRAAIEAEAEALIRATAAANAGAGAGAGAGAAGRGDTGPAATTPEERAAQLERDLDVEFEPGFSVQQRIRILQALTSRRERRAAAAAAAAAATAAAGAAAEGNDFDRGMRARLLNGVRAYRERRAAAAAADAAAADAAAAGDVDPQPHTQDRIAAALRTLNQRQQQQQVSESDSEVEEALDRMYGLWAGATGLNLGPAGTTEHDVATNTRDTQDLPIFDEAIYEYSDDEVPDLLVGGPSEDSEEGLDDAAGQGIWQIEAPGTEIRRDWALQNPRGSGRPQVIRYRSTGVNPRFPIRGTAGGNGGYRCGELFSAYLTLLGTCYKQPVVLLLDEADAALVAGEGLGCSQVLMRVLCMVPQAIIMLCCSYKSEVLGGAGSPLRQQGQDVQYALVDGTLNIACHKIPKTLYYRCFL